MLNPFPELLVYSFFAPTILRMAVALLSFYVTYATLRNRADIMPQLAWASALANLLVGSMLLFGYYTQIAVLAALVFWAASFFVTRQYLGLVRLSVGTRLLVIAICLSLLLSGAGALAYDLPL